MAGTTPIKTGPVSEHGGALVDVFDTPHALADAAAELVVARASEAIARTGRFSLMLSGGTTPRQLYARLASRPSRDRIDWGRVRLFWGDERCVPPADSASNYRMARDTLIDHVPVPAAHVYRIKGEDDPALAAAEYERTLRAALGEGANRNMISGPDLVLLGLGVDGHTASLFPHKAAARETVRWVVAEEVDVAPTWRVTVTPLFLNKAPRVLFLVSGSEKAATLRAVLEGPAALEALPAQRIASRGHSPLWMVDRAAAGLLARTRHATAEFPL